MNYYQSINQSINLPYITVHTGIQPSGKKQLSQSNDKSELRIELSLSSHHHHLRQQVMCKI
jgi:hypothetical protein